MKAKYSFWKESVIYLIILIPFAVIYYFWNDLPEQIPMHWNFAGEVDSWGSKTDGLGMLPLLNIFLYILFLVLPRLDPKRENYSLFDGAYYTIRLMIHLFIASMLVVTVVYSLGYDVNISRFVINYILILFIVIGNVLGNVRYNYTIGIRMPWTLASEHVWRKTHRFASKLWVSSSLITIFTGLLLGEEILKYLFMANIGVIIIIPTVYSYRVFREEKNGKREKH